MSCEFNHYQNNQYRHFHTHHKTPFLPLLCRLSNKDVKLPKCPSTTTTATAHLDPTSPKVGCMGQVKRSNKITGFPSNHRFTPPATTTTALKYTKLKKLFSGKNLTSTTTTAATATSNCRRRRNVVNIGELDPPLPVVKKLVPGGGREEVCIWKRRFNGNGNGNGFKCLEIQRIQVPNINYVPPLTV